MKTKFLAGALLVAMTAVSACVSTNANNQFSSSFDEYLNYMECVSLRAGQTLDRNPNTDIGPLIRASIPSCREPFEAYQSVILDEQRRINNVENFDPIVKETLDQRLEDRTVETLTPFLEEIYRG